MATIEEAREYARSLKLKGQKGWQKYVKENDIPEGMSTYPDKTYKDKGWKGWGDFLGTRNISTHNFKKLPFDEVREFAHSLGLKNREGWVKYVNEPKNILREGIPRYPNGVYENEGWKGWGDFLGTGTRAPQDFEPLPFEEAKKIVQSWELKDRNEFRSYAKKEGLPDGIPANPSRTYEGEGWKGWGDFLGTGRQLYRRFQSLPFEEAKKIVHSFGLGGQEEYRGYIKENRPDGIPRYPDDTYEGKGWKGWKDWLGSEKLPFPEAKEIVHSFGLGGKEEYRRYIKENRPDGIPANPRWTYEGKGWKGWGDFLGTGTRAPRETGWNIQKVKELLRDLIESKVIDTFSEVRLHNLLYSKGVLNLEKNRHTDFFKNLIKAARTEEGKKAITDYAYSGKENPPDLSDGEEGEEGEIQTVNSEELAKYIDGSDPLDHGKINTPEQILKQTEFLESICVDEEKMQFQVTCSVQDFWKSAFVNEIDTVNKVRSERLNGKEFHDTIVETFLSEYDGTKSIEIPKEYSFPKKPRLMQRYVAYKIKTNPYFGNFSGTGAGKTLSAILASRVIDSKMTIIICPNDVVNQWRDDILRALPDSKVITEKPAFKIKYDENKHQYLVLNYDKFSQDDSPELILELVKQKIDFLVIDEIHFAKQRYEEAESQRRESIRALRSFVRKKNPDVKVLVMSATPVINNLTEGRSLLDLMVGKEYDDVATRATIPNAVNLHEKLTLVSVREMPKYTYKEHFLHVQAPRLPEEIRKELQKNPLQIEQYLTEARIPEIINNIKGQTIIYTEYVREIVKKLKMAVQDVGFSCAEYTGTDHSGLEMFKNGKVQVLVASKPVSTAIDGLQNNCNRLIINTLPWTRAGYEQLIGRLDRMGQTERVDVFVIKASIGGYEYDEKIKWQRIQFKRSLADCAVDGILPEKNLVTPQQATMAAIQMLERLEREEISYVTRRNLDVELSPKEKRERFIKIGDFTKLNNKFNRQKSETTYEQITQNPVIWEEYHRQFREKKKDWPINPVDEIIKTIVHLKLPSRFLTKLVIGDFGCGEAKIAEALTENKVHSFDFVAINDKVMACDMKSAPLDDESLDVAVFSLSLMGTNWTDFIAKAKRCLVKNGYLFIAETTKSLSARLSELRNVIKEQGFEIYTDEERGDFTFIDARKL